MHEYPVIFICRTCESYNKQYRGQTEMKETTFTSLTEAWEHLYNTNRDRDDLIHHIDAAVKINDQTVHGGILRQEMLSNMQKN